MKDRYNLDLFYSGKGSEPKYLHVQGITEDIFSTTELCIVALAMDFPHGTSAKARKELENKWLKLCQHFTMLKPFQFD